MPYVLVVASGGNAVTEPGFTPKFQDCLCTPHRPLRSLRSKLRPGRLIIGMYHMFGDLSTAKGPNV